MKCLYAAKITEITNHMNGRFKEVQEAIKDMKDELVKYKTTNKTPITTRFPVLPTSTMEYKVTQ